MAKPNYQFEKRQRDLAKKRKQEEKLRQKLANKNAADGTGTEPDAAANPPEAAPPEDGSADAASPDSAPKTGE